MHAAETLLDAAIDQLVIDRRGFPTHPRQQPHGLHRASPFFDIIERDQAGEQRARFGICHAVHAGGAEMALERSDGFFQRRVGVVAKACKKRRHLRFAGISALDGPEPDSLPGQCGPGKQFAGIVLAHGRDIAMAQHAPGGNGVAGENAACQFDQRRDLRFGKGAIAEFMAGIDQLDADGAGIDVARAGPIGNARMPGAALFRHQRIDRAILVDHVMRRDFGGGIAHPRQRRFAAWHAGVMQHQHVDGRIAPRHPDWAMGGPSASSAGLARPGFGHRRC